MREKELMQEHWEALLKRQKQDNRELKAELSRATKGTSTKKGRKVH